MATPPDPGRKTVFKINTGKFLHSQNIPEYCGHCMKVRPKKATPFPLCSGCKSMRFCSRDHQIKGWPKHKSFCQSQQNTNKIMEEHEENTLGLPPIQERKYLLEDFAELHRRSVEVAVASAVHANDPPIDLQTQYLVFNLSYNPKCGGNPSMAFILKSAVVDTEPPEVLGLPITTNFKLVRPIIANLDAEEKIHPNYGGAVICLYYIDGEYPWMTFRTFSKSDLLSLSEEDHRNWPEMLKGFINGGIIYRVTGSKGGKWTPGLMEKSGNNWIWVQKSLEELQLTGSTTFLST